MKKYIVFLLVAVLAAGCLSACGSRKTDDGKLRIVATIFPEYDWVKSVLGDAADSVELTLLLDKGVDLHSYQPTADDILKISTCDLFIYVGGESDAWVSRALAQASNKKMIVINLLDVLGEAVKEEELVEGMQEGEHEHGKDDHDEDDHDEDGDHHNHDEDEIEYDEHVWLSLRNAQFFVKSITDALVKLDPDNADKYRLNESAYITNLGLLDAMYREAVEQASTRTLLFADRFPFRYMTDDYGLKYYAAFAGCSAESEASFETITFLSNKVDELGLPAVMVIEGGDHRIANTVVENTKSKSTPILALDSMQSATAKDVKNGLTYLSVMEKNLAVLKEALK